MITKQCCYTRATLLCIHGICARSAEPPSYLGRTKPLCRLRARGEREDKSSDIVGVCLRYSIPGNGEHAATCIWVREQGKRRPKRNDFMIGPPWAAQSGCAQARGRFQPHREFSRYCFPEATGNGVARLLPSWTEGKYTRLSFTGSLFEQQC